MTLSDLDHEQQVALAALAEAIALSDGEVTEREGDQLGRIARELGEDTYRALLDEAERAFPTVTQLKAFLLTIEDQPARELMYRTAMQEAFAEITFDNRDIDLLDWLARQWDIEVSIEPETDDQDA